MRHARLLHNYQGLSTQNQTIAPGDYAPDDERLFGLADYLVESRHAEWIDVAEPVAEAPPIPERADEAPADDEAAPPEPPADLPAPPNRRTKRG